jgi:hypothetical protein
MKGLHIITCILLLVGGLNWLLFGLGGNDIGGYLLGGMDTTASKVVYILVGLAAIVEIITHKKVCKMCEGGSAPSAM